MKSVVAASLIAGALACSGDLSFQCPCSGDTSLQPPASGCYKGDSPFGGAGWQKTVITIAPANADSGVLSWKAIGSQEGEPWYHIFECNSKQYVRKGTRYVYEDEGDLDNCVVGRDPRLAKFSFPKTHEIEYCPDQDTIRFTARGTFQDSTILLQRGDDCSDPTDPYHPPVAV